jgi:ferric-dicitrate binding protein FerR (iron transport regulator)
MQNQDLDKDYSKYSFEDFLQDDIFVSSIKNENAEFWENLKKRNRINPEAFCSAKYFLESLEEHNDASVADSELSALWTKVQASNRKKKSYKIWIYIGSCAAACVILLMVFPYVKSAFRISDPQDIVSFAQENVITNDNENIQIILSENETIKIDEADTDIVYDSTEIKIDRKEVLKKESAAYNQLIVPKGKRSRLTLSDGTKLVVNAGTRVVYPIEFVEKKREIYIDGEIFIDVAHNESKPFIVKTSDLNIQVLGTRFNIMAYAEDPNKQVVLAKGSVKIQKNNKVDKSDETILKPSEMYEYNSGHSKVVNVDVSYYTSWVDGVYVFESRKLSDVALRLSLYYGIDIICSEEAKNFKCSGKMDLKDNPEDIFKGLSFSFPVKIENNENKYIIKKI